LVKNRYEAKLNVNGGPALGQMFGIIRQPLLHLFKPAPLLGLKLHPLYIVLALILRGNYEAGTYI